MPEKVSDQETQSQGKKRKQPPHRTDWDSTQSTQSSQGYSQSTIPDFFLANSTATDSNISDMRPETPKRSRRNSEEAQATSALTERVMLSFPVSTVIDLTSSPPPAGGDSTTSTSKPGEPPARPAPFQPQAGGPRRFQVKNLRIATRADPELYFNRTWESLNAALEAIFDELRISHSLEELYRGTENICRAGDPGRLFERLRGRCDDYIGQQLKTEVEEYIRRDKEETVKVVVSAWVKWCEQLDKIRSIFLYLDRSYLLHHASLQPIEATGLGLFRTHIAMGHAIAPKFLNGIFNLFERDRQGLEIDPLLLISSIRLMVNLGLYHSHFEPKFLQMTREYYERVATLESTSDTLAEYLQECSKEWAKETARCDGFFLDLSTRRSIVALIEDEFIRKQLPFLIDQRNVGELIMESDNESLATLYYLLSRIGDAGFQLKPAWESQIISFGLGIIADVAQESEMVRRLLEFKASLDAITRGPFKNCETLGYSLRESFTHFINARREGESMARHSKPAEMVAKYVDGLLRDGTKRAVAGAQGDDDARLAHALEQVLDLFRFIQGKDVFEAFYKKDLARRLLMDRSASGDAERSMLAKLKTECGAGFTHNLEGMFKDVDLSKEAMASFKLSKAGAGNPRGIDFSVNVLSQAAWPTYPEVPVNIPEVIARYLESYQTFYTSKYSGRKIMWRHALAHCILKATFPKGMKELVLSVLQAVVLLLFNDIPDRAVLTYNELKDGSGLGNPLNWPRPIATETNPLSEDVQLIRTLQSLACARYKILTKTPKGRDVAPTDVFCVNLKFSDPKVRLKINQIQLKETKKENTETHERVAQDRQYEAQAAIVRIMKSRKKCGHSELVALTIEQTKNRGVLDVAEIKKQIDRLIEKEYIERAPGEEAAYQYAA